jgi:hypothetical protein
MFSRRPVRRSLGAGGLPLLIKLAAPESNGGGLVAPKCDKGGLAAPELNEGGW